MIPKDSENLKLCYMDTDSLLYHIKNHDFYPDIARDVKERFDMSGFTDSIPLPMGYNRKVTRLMKDELGGNIMTGFVALRQKSYAYTKLDNKEDKRCEGVKKCVVKNTISFSDYKNCLSDS